MTLDELTNTHFQTNDIIKPSIQKRDPNYQLTNLRRDISWKTVTSYNLSNIQPSLQSRGGLSAVKHDSEQKECNLFDLI